MQIFECLILWVKSVSSGVLLSGLWVSLLPSVLLCSGSWKWCTSSVEPCFWFSAITASYFFEVLSKTSSLPLTGISGRCLLFLLEVPLEGYSFAWVQSCWWGSPAFCSLCLLASFCRAVIKCQPVMQPHILLGFLIFLNYHFIYLLGPSGINFQQCRYVCFQCFILQNIGCWQLGVHWCCPVAWRRPGSFLMWFLALL